MKPRPDTPESHLAERLRGAYPAPDCPPLEKWHELALGAVDAASLLRLESHALSCPACAAELRLARSFEEPIAESDAVAEITRALRQTHQSAKSTATLSSSPPRSSRRRWGRSAMAAAALVLTVFGVGLLYVSQQGPPPLRDPGSGAVVRSATLEALEPVGELDAAPQRFAWSQAPETATYTLTLETVSGQVLLQERIAGSSFEVPGDVVAQLEPAVTYHWRVDASNSSGELLARSPLTEFRLAPSLEGTTDPSEPGHENTQSR